MGPKKYAVDLGEVDVAYAVAHGLEEGCQTDVAGRAEDGPLSAAKALGGTIGVDFAEKALCELPRRRSERPFEATILPTAMIRTRRGKDRFRGTYASPMARIPRSLLFLILSACGDEPAPDPAALAHRAALEGEHEEAAGHYRDATELRGEDASAWIGLARERLRAGLNATEAAERAVELSDSADAHELLGRALLASAPTERGAEAASALERALELDPHRWRIDFALGRAHEAAGNREAAIRAYRSAAEAEVLPARALVAAVRVSLDLHRADELAVPAMLLGAELDRAEELAEGDEAANRAIAAQRRRLRQEDPDLVIGAGAAGDGADLLGAIGVRSLLGGSGAPFGGATLDDGMDEPSFGQRATEAGFRDLDDERRPGMGSSGIGIGTLGTRGEAVVGPTGGRASSRLTD